MGLIQIVIGEPECTENINLSLLGPIWTNLGPTVQPWRTYLIKRLEYRHHVNSYRYLAPCRYLAMHSLCICIQYFNANLCDLLAISLPENIGIWLKGSIEKIKTRKCNDLIPGVRPYRVGGWTRIMIMKLEITNEV